MKKILSFTLAIIMAFSMSVLWGCNGNSDNTATSGSTPDESSLAGQWVVVTTDDEVQWSMNSQNTLHITENRAGLMYTTVCKYSYDKDTGAFEYTCLSADGSFQGTLKPEGNNQLIIVSNDNLTEVRLRRVDLTNQ